MKQLVLLCMAVVLFAAGCGKPQMQDAVKEESVKAEATSPTPVQEPKAVTESVTDRLEKELRQAAADSQVVAVRREGNILIVTLTGDATFDANSTKVSPRLFRELDRIAEILKQFTQASVRIEGHTDSRGSEKRNLELSRKRAESVKELLVKRGVDEFRMIILPFGPTAPIASNDTESGRRQNRRVEIKIVSQE